LRREYFLIPVAIWLVSIFLIQILGAIYAPDSSVIPDECPKNSGNCERELLFYSGSPESVHSAALEWVDAQTMASIIDSNNTESHTVFRTSWLMFPDDFYLTSKCTQSGTSLQIHSESRLGLSDLGVNSNRIDELVEYLDNIEFEPHICSS